MGFNLSMNRVILNMGRLGLVVCLSLPYWVSVNFLKKK